MEGLWISKSLFCAAAKHAWHGEGSRSAHQPGAAAVQPQLRQDSTALAAAVAGFERHAWRPCAIMHATHQQEAALHYSG